MEKKKRKKVPARNLPGEFLEDICLLGQAVEQCSEGIAISDLKGNLLFVNQAFASMHGYVPNELIGKHLSIFHSSRQLSAVKAANRKVQDTGEFIGEIRHIRKDGTEFPSAMHNSLLRDESGTPTGMIAMLHDITEQKQAEEALHIQIKRFRDVAENAREWIWEMDARGQYTYASPAVKKILGYRSGEILKKHFYDYFHPQDRPQLKKTALEVFAQKKPFREFINRNVHKDGRSVWLSTSGVPILNGDGELLGYRGVDIDITDQKEADRELEKYRRDLEELVEERTARLKSSNLELRRVIKEQRKTQAALKNSEKELKEQKKALEDKNIALREVLEQLEIEKKQIRDGMASSVEKLVIPSLHKIRKTEARPSDQALDTLERNLKKLASPSELGFSDPRLKLTPREIEICDLIQSGLPNKEISRVLHLSRATVEKHRENIRKKFGISRKKINLRSFLYNM